MAEASTTSPPEPAVGHTATIVAAFVSNHAVAIVDLNGLINTVHSALAGLGREPALTTEAERPTPAISIKRSITPDYLVCLEDGKKLKMLKRHLRSRYNLTPDEYRARWGLSPDYPMVAANYSRARSDHARALGLGLKPSARPARASKA